MNIKVILDNFRSEQSKLIKEDPNDILDNHLMVVNKKQQDDFLKEKLWKKDPLYFKKVRVSLKSAIKMLTHATSGGDIEVMGLLLGKIEEEGLIIVDTFELPVEGTETRVNAASEANEFLIEYLEMIKETGRLENIVGWYHSHPGYGCWLSGIDVATQNLNQQFQDPFLAIVVDPKRSASSGRLELGAFRTYPQGYTPKKKENEIRVIPAEKEEDYGVHADKYYQLSVEYFHSERDRLILDKLGEKNWINELVKDHILTNEPFHFQQQQDLNLKFKKTIDLIEDIPTNQINPTYNDSNFKKRLNDFLQRNCTHFNNYEDNNNNSHEMEVETQPILEKGSSIDLTEEPEANTLENEENQSLNNTMDPLSHWLVGAKKLTEDMESDLLGEFIKYALFDKKKFH